jgi:hypothetical protein
MQGVLRGMRGSVGCILCQKWLRLTGKVDECKPLPCSSLCFTKSSLCFVNFSARSFAMAAAA